MLTFKRKLILNNAQKTRIDSWIDTCRMVYNLGLEIKISAWKNRQESVHKYDLMKQITVIRGEYSYIKNVPVCVLQRVMERLDISYKTFFNGGGFPKWASKRKYTSVQFVQNRGLIKVYQNKLNIQKIGELKMVKDAPVIGIIKNVTIKKEVTGFYATIQCENVPAKFESENQAIGLDMGISHFCVDSNGLFIENPRHFKRYERKLRIE